MKFDVYEAVYKDGVWMPGVHPLRMTLDELLTRMNQPDIREILTEVRNGNKESKMKLPSVCWHGIVRGERRVDNDCVPTQLVMLDVDHCEHGDFDIQEVIKRIKNHDELSKCTFMVHLTPSLGIRVVFKAVKDFSTIEQHMLWGYNELMLSDFGEIDVKVKNIGRISFLVSTDDVRYINRDIVVPDVLEGPIKSATLDVSAPEKQEYNTRYALPEFSDEEKAKYDVLEYRGTVVKVIIDRYVEVNGKPSDGEVHNYYNEMVKYFRCITSNDKRALLYLLPRFGHTANECWSQIVSITKVNTLSSLPKPFYFFLKDNGFYKSRVPLKEDEEIEENTEVEKIPPLPPIFRECVRIAPPDFRVSVINSLMPILGTLTSYLEAEYPYDSRIHTTSFFSVIYAPAGTGKGFCERFVDLFFKYIKLRDYVSSYRENMYLRVISKKGANDKAPDQPHVSLRLMPAKNSEAEFLAKQEDNKGYHMFTFAAEMDSWAKGAKAAGGNKDDMIRIAWDNGEYGQQFKSANTFKGTVRLYWNVLITGTLMQLKNYFKNVENGLVTRCAFSTIPNQEFALPQVWKKLSKKELELIDRFLLRCDEMTYEKPCEIDTSSFVGMSDADFDKEVDWHFTFREKQRVDMSWIMPTINKFQEEQTGLASKNVDKARDAFRRRVGVRGFRLALLCYGLYENPRQQNLDRIIAFVDWWMHKDLENMILLWGDAYNELEDEVMLRTQPELYKSLDIEFTVSDLKLLCDKYGVKSPPRRIIFDWKRLGYIEKIESKRFKKKTKI